MQRLLLLCANAVLHIANHFIHPLKKLKPLFFRYPTDEGGLTNQILNPTLILQTIPQVGRHKGIEGIEAKQRYFQAVALNEDGVVANLNFA